MNKEDGNSQRRKLYSINKKQSKEKNNDSDFDTRSKVLNRRYKKVIRHKKDREIHERRYNHTRDEPIVKNHKKRINEDRINNHRKNDGRHGFANDKNTVHKGVAHHRIDRLRSQKPKFVSRKTKHKRIVFRRLFLLTTSFVLLIIFLLSTVFTKTSVVVQSERLPFSISGTFTAIRSPLVGEDISYTLKGPITTEVNETIEAKKQTRQITKAQGKVILYNTHQKGEPLDLINRTRLVFESEVEEFDSSGKGDCKLVRCWRLKGPETIPGGKQKGGEFIPGSKEVTIVADRSGKNYNIEEIGSRFIIPGLQGNKSFSDSFAESLTVIVGGFEGIKYVAEDDVYEEATKKLESQIQSNLTEKLYTSIEKLKNHPEIVFEDGLFIENQKVIEKQGNEEITLSQKGLLRAVSFRELLLAELIYSSIDGPYEEMYPINIEDSNLEFEIVDKKFIDEDDTNGEFDFTLSGNGVLVWDVDELTLFRDIKNKDKKEVSSIISIQYPWIKSYELKIFPFWNKKVSQNKNSFELEKE